mmetsp:Transcript_7903/g.19385  ORF Transcript_7903/g.19385 Transcript_7903/m.19385 type:complete len:405 (-) Transcript_7903:3369-4583(-)
MASKSSSSAASTSSPRRYVPPSPSSSNASSPPSAQPQGRHAASLPPPPPKPSLSSAHCDPCSPFKSSSSSSSSSSISPTATRSLALLLCVRPSHMNLLPPIAIAPSPPSASQPISPPAPSNACMLLLLRRRQSAPPQASSPSLPLPPWLSSTAIACLLMCVVVWDTAPVLDMLPATSSSSTSSCTSSSPLQLVLLLKLRQAKGRVAPVATSLLLRLLSLLGSPAMLLLRLLCLLASPGVPLLRLLCLLPMLVVVWAPPAMMLVVVCTSTPTSSSLGPTEEAASPFPGWWLRHQGWGSFGTRLISGVVWAVLYAEKQVGWEAGAEALLTWMCAAGFAISGGLPGTCSSSSPSSRTPPLLLLQLMRCLSILHSWYSSGAARSASWMTTLFSFGLCRDGASLSDLWL